MHNKFKNMLSLASTNKKNKQIEDVKNNLVANSLYPNKLPENCNFEIPNNIFQTWETKKLPPLMFNSINNIKNNNPRFNYFLFDDNDCREFIRNNFPICVLNAYNRLIPGAYKADLWRYCILYKKGGIYMDIKYQPINGFKLFNLLEKEHWTKDINENNVYNAIMVCKAGNPILLEAIVQICKNVKNKYYGEGYLDPTGPGLLSKYFNSEEKKLFDIKHVLCGNNDDKYIKFNEKYIFKCYSGYFSERNSSKTEHYAILWNKKKIYL